MFRGPKGDILRGRERGGVKRSRIGRRAAEASSLKRSELQEGRVGNSTAHRHIYLCYSGLFKKRDGGTISTECGG